MSKSEHISRKDICDILILYDLKYRNHLYFKEGTVQINIYIETESEGKYVLRYYRNRKLDEILFEIDVLNYLSSSKYPSPKPILQKSSNKCKYYGSFEDKIFVLFSFIEGKILRPEEFSELYQLKIIRRISELHSITSNAVLTEKKVALRNKEKRMNYDIHFLLKKIEELEIKYSSTSEILKKLEWMSSVVNEEMNCKDMEEHLPKGICHGDFHHSNFLFHEKGDYYEVSGIIDFDDCNITYLLFDLVNFIDYWCWIDSKKFILDLDRIRKILKIYDESKSQKFTEFEKSYFYDVYLYQVLLDTIWFIERDKFDDFGEKKKIEFLINFGKEKFSKLFPNYDSAVKSEPSKVQILMY